MKYGVISTGSLVEDLTKWTNIYAAGRLHKPVQVIKSHPLVDQALGENKKYALSVALLLLPRVFTEIDLYLKVASLSYIGVCGAYYLFASRMLIM